jgi:hypothetical protein
LDGTQGLDQFERSQRLLGATNKFYTLVPQVPTRGAAPRQEARFGAMRVDDAHAGAVECQGFRSHCAGLFAAESLPYSANPAVPPSITHKKSCRSGRLRSLLRSVLRLM